MSKSKHIFLNGVKYEKDNILSAEAMEKSLIILLNVCDGEKIKDVTIQYHNINNFKADRVKLNKLMEELHKQQEEYYDLLKASHNKPLIDEALENADKLNSFDFSLKQILSLTSYDSYFDSIVCILERCTSGIIDDERFNGINRTEYCKEFFKE